MISRSYQQYAIVAADSAQELTEQLNEKLKTLKCKYPKVTFEGLIARIQYTESVQIVEELSDEYELQGVRLTCQDCPMFQPLLKQDGTKDKRAKWGDCPFAHFGRTSRNSSACSRLFEMMNSGEVRLCLAESEE